MVGGTLSLLRRILFCLWSKMYLGHLTNLVKSLLGWMSPPTLKFLGLDSKRGFLTFLTEVFFDAYVFFPLTLKIDICFMRIP